MRRIAIAGLVALAAVLGGIAVPAAALGGVAVPAAALAGPASGVRPAISGRPADDGPITTGTPIVSCVLATDCLGAEASSSLTDGGPTVSTRVERWDGSSWKRLGVTLPAGARSVDLNGISCRGAKSCLVVGDYYTSTSESAPDYPLALIYNGTSLRPTSPVPTPKGLDGVTLDGVSCTTATHCVAVGTANGYTKSSQAELEVAMIETWDGAKWTLHNVTASSASSMLQVAGVSCATGSFCVLDGDSFTVSSNSATIGTWLAAWNGKTLTRMKSPVAMLPTAVSCATVSNCAVTGINPDIASSAAATTISSTEIWNGKAWRAAPVSWPKGTGESMTFALSCYAARTCEMVGLDGPAAENSEDAVAVAFTGIASKRQAVPAPAKGDSTVLTGVSCLPSGTCVAVGQTGKTNSSSSSVMTGVWNGRAWRLNRGF
jgi:hypothetical protein